MLLLPRSQHYMHHQSASTAPEALTVPRQGKRDFNRVSEKQSGESQKEVLREESGDSEKSLVLLHKP